MKTAIVRTLAFLLIATIGGMADLSADILWNNGGLSTGPTSGSGVAAPAGTNWSENQNNTGNTTESNTVAGFSAYRNAAQTTHFRMADDFTVGPNQTWFVDNINTFAYRTGNNTFVSPFATMNIQIWNGRPGDVGSTVIFGDMSTNRLQSSTFSNLYRIFNSTTPAPGTVPGTTRPIWMNTADLTGLTLTAGTYWIDYNFTMVDDTFTAFAPPVTVPGSRGLAGWNGRQRVSAGTWQDLIDGGNPATAPDVQQDLPFIFNGTAIPEPGTWSLLILGSVFVLNRRRR